MSDNITHPRDWVLVLSEYQHARSNLRSLKELKSHLSKTPKQPLKNQLQLHFQQKPLLPFERELNSILIHLFETSILPQLFPSTISERIEYWPFWPKIIISPTTTIYICPCSEHQKSLLNNKLKALHYVKEHELQRNNNFLQRNTYKNKRTLRTLPTYLPKTEFHDKIRPPHPISQKRSHHYKN